MNDKKEQEYLEAELARQRRHRMAQRRRRKKRIRRRRLLALAGILALGTGIFCLRTPPAHGQKAEPVKPAETAAPVQSTQPVQAAQPPFAVKRTAPPAAPGKKIDSRYAIMIDADTGEVLAEKKGETVISPASMTKILTVLVAAEHVENLDDTVPITIDITDLCYQNECSAVGYMVGDTPTVRELMYGTILPSGADAALALANYVSGSQEAFAELMNQKLEELGISDTAHFTNCIGLYDENHHCTVEDMALIMRAAIKNGLCRKVLSARVYTTAATESYPDGQELSNWFLRRIEDKDTGSVKVLGAKTGYVEQSGSCAASYGRDEEGHRWICVTGKAGSAWQAIYDHVTLYSTYCKSK